MKPTAPEHIVEFMSYSRDSRERATEFKKFSRREWERAFRWLDVAGLSFYFLQKLKNSNTTDAVPAWIMSRLENNLEANRLRVGYMAQQFSLLNEMFNEAGVRYLVLKGLSLVPQFCPDPLLRYQGDFDYLVDNRSLVAAQRILVEAGYRAKLSPSSQEFIFVLQGMGEPSRRDERYYARTPHAVELHLDIWDAEMDGVPLIPKLFFVERTTTHHIDGLSFSALADEDAFLLQVFHTCHHLFSHWVRMSCLFEVAYFLSQRASDVELWDRVDQRVGDSLVLREFVVVVSELAAMLFAAPIPPLVCEWGLRIRPAPRVWIENYARPWAFGEMPVHQFSWFPRAKLVRFLHQQYRNGALDRKAAAESRALPPSRLSRIASSARNDPRVVFDIAWWKRHLLIERLLFHVLAGLRYFCEIPRWAWLNRTTVRSASLESRQHDSPVQRLPVER